MLPRASAMQAGVFCFNPPYGVRIGGDAGERRLLDLYAGMGRALARFRGWRAACFVANPPSKRRWPVAVMKKPATNAELPGAFLVYQL